VAFQSPGSDTSHYGLPLHASQDDGRYILDSVAACDPQAEATELACAEALFDRLLRVYTSPVRSTVHCVREIYMNSFVGFRMCARLRGLFARKWSRTRSSPWTEQPSSSTCIKL
jgi:hypothetical protein